ncbi:Alpha-D-glucose-1-phosphate phosphatase YihX [Marinomonas aquimarina]|uniref:Alpha-D-glucose-1-phosphate phosphatase YihX n=2 Tax=Marinomonas aquimarina TaxID=295068 RepID=A0A1A8T3W4_9GAMM|nr:Alpha-D-glucose-1-phosphate phosphatase YihX [Marinomonas aquimarina]
MIEVVLFDLGNVLVDLGSQADFAKVFQVEVGSEAQLWEMWLESPSVKAFDSGQIPLPVFVERLLAETDSNVDQQSFTDNFINWPKGLFDGAIELVQSIPSHYHRAVLSNTNDAHWARLMDEMGLSGLFHSYFASHQMGLVKPDLAVFDYVVKELAVEPNKILFLDDNLINVEGALTKGIQAEQVKGIACAREILYTYGVIR